MYFPSHTANILGKIIPTILELNKNFTPHNTAISDYTIICLKHVMTLNVNERMSSVLFIHHCYGSLEFVINERTIISPQLVVPTSTFPASPVIFASSTCLRFYDVCTLGILHRGLKNFLHNFLFSYIFLIIYGIYIRFLVKFNLLFL